MDNGLTDADERFPDVRDDIIADLMGDIEAGDMGRATHMNWGYGTKRRPATVAEAVQECLAGDKEQPVMAEIFALVGALAAGPTGTEHHIRAKAVLSKIGEVYGRIVEDIAADIAAQESGR